MVKSTVEAPAATSEVSDLVFRTPAPQQPKTSSLKTIAEIEAALQQEVDRDIVMRLDKYDYIPWNDAVRLANRIFGVSGRDIELRESRLESVPNEEGKLTHGYTTIVRITVYPADSRPFYQDGLGFSELIFTRSGQAMIDSSIKGSASRALLRSLVLTGEAFGLAFYDKNDTQAATGAAQRTTQQTSTPYTGQANTPNTYQGGGRSLSDKQVNILTEKLGVTAEVVRALPFDAAKGAIDALFAKTAPWDVAKSLGIEYVKKTDRLPIPV